MQYSHPDSAVAGMQASPPGRPVSVTSGAKVLSLLSSVKLADKGERVFETQFAYCPNLNVLRILYLFTRKSVLRIGVY